MPDAARLHRGSKLAGRVAVYTHRDPRQVMNRLSGEKIHRAVEIPIRFFGRVVIEAIAGLVERRTSCSLSVTGGEIYLSIGGCNFTLPLDERRLESAKIG